MKCSDSNKRFVWYWNCCLMIVFYLMTGSGFPGGSGYASEWDLCRRNHSTGRGVCWKQKSESDEPQWQHFHTKGGQEYGKCKLIYTGIGLKIKYF